MSALPWNEFLRRFKPIEHTLVPDGWFERLPRHLQMRVLRGLSDPQYAVGRPVREMFKRRGIGRKSVLEIAEIVAGMYH